MTGEVMLSQESEDWIKSLRGPDQAMVLKLLLETQSSVKDKQRLLQNIRPTFPGSDHWIQMIACEHGVPFVVPDEGFD